MTSSPGDLLLEMRGIGKSFPGIRALDGVDLDLRAGEIHSVVGENGAGKSTLMNILGGVQTRYDGEIRLAGRLRRFSGVHDAQQAGIAFVHQELSLVPEMSVAENIFLGREPRTAGLVRWNQLHAGARRLLDDLKLTVDTGTPVAQLGVGRRQLVEIAKALAQSARILVLDEPTAALTESEAQGLFALLQRLQARGMGILYISHRLREVFALSDRITVLRDGRKVGSFERAAFDEQRVVRMMVGRDIGEVFPESLARPGEVVLEVRGLTVRDPALRHKLLVHDVSFSLRKGEVLGIAGLMGAGRSELLLSIFGAQPGRVAGTVALDGSEVSIRSPADAIGHGIGLITEDRKALGLVLEHSVLHNITLAALSRVAGPFLLRSEREIASARAAAADLRIRSTALFSPVAELSGGNQQKVVLARWLLTDARVLLLDEPTRGVDVGAKQEIYALVRRLAAAGKAILLVSSELPELLGLSDRVLVLHQGRLTGDFSRADASPERVMACATGPDPAAGIAPASA